MPRRIRGNSKNIVAYQGGEHRTLRDGCVVIEGNEILYVGRSFGGSADEVVDAGDRVITPGLMNRLT